MRYHIHGRGPGEFVILDTEDDSIFINLQERRNRTIRFYDHFINHYSVVSMHGKNELNVHKSEKTCMLTVVAIPITGTRREVTRLDFRR